MRPSSVYYLFLIVFRCLFCQIFEFSDQCGSNLTSERGIIIASRNSKADDCVWHLSPPGEDLKTHLVFVKFYVPSAGGARSCAENCLEIRVGKNLVSNCFFAVLASYSLKNGDTLVDDTCNGGKGDGPISNDDTGDGDECDGISSDAHDGDV